MDSSLGVDFDGIAGRLGLELGPGRDRKMQSLHMCRTRR